jgi:hypothetical protein
VEVLDADYPDNPAESKGDSERFATGMPLFTGAPDRCLPPDSCNLARILRISVHGPSDLLSPLYDASRAQVTSVR